MTSYIVSWFDDSGHKKSITVHTPKAATLLFDTLQRDGAEPMMRTSRRIFNELTIVIDGKHSRKL